VRDVRTLSAAEALGLLRRGEAVRDARILEPLDLRALTEGDELFLPVHFADCLLRQVEAVDLQFHERVALQNCTVQSADSAFFAAYFVGGLSVTGCTFESEVDFQCGGHNQGGAVVALEGNTFRGFVNFFDCWFEGPVVVRRYRFEGGTNLLGNQGHPCRVTFDVPPVIEENFGDLALDGG
jgi:hypothetical protein